MTDCALSIIIPHFDIPDLLDRLLRTIPTISEIQVIVVDDNSLKGLERLEEVVQDRKKSGQNLELYTNETGMRSAGTCRNIGLEHAKGKWVLFADADDFFLDGWYEKVRKYFETEYEVVFFLPTGACEEGNLNYDPAKLRADQVRAWLSQPSLNNELQLRYNYFVPWSKLIQKNFINKYQIEFEQVKYGNDVMFSAKCGFYFQRFFVSEESIYCYLWRENNLSTIPDPKNYDIRMRGKIRWLSFLFSHLTVEEINALGLNIAPFALLREARRREDVKQYVGEYYHTMRSLNLPLLNWRFYIKHPVQTAFKLNRVK